MTVETINTSTFLSDLIIFIRDDLLSNLTDPISASRMAGRDFKFVQTSYPTRETQYPLITIVDSNSVLSRLGMRSTQMSVMARVEIRVWARKIAERDELAQNVVNQFRSDQFSGSDYSDTVGFHDLDIISMVNVDEPGEEGIKSKVITIGGLIIIGG